MNIPTLVYLCIYELCMLVALNSAVPSIKAIVMLDRATCRELEKCLEQGRGRGNTYVVYYSL